MIATPRRLAAALLEQACGFRHGIVPPVELVEGTFADVADVYNACISGDGLASEAAGGFARTEESARSAAIAEALERYAARMARLEVCRGDALDGKRLIGRDAFALFDRAQEHTPGFPWPRRPPRDCRYAEVFSLVDNTAAWVPEELVGLGPREGAPSLPSTSTGLAAHGYSLAALLRATEELLERDALAVAWLASLGGRELALDDRYRAPVDALGGEVACFSFTQQWNPHPVVAVAGQIPLRGRKRFSLGAACRADHAQAIEKAWLEWLQGVVFAGYYVNEHPTLRFGSPAEVRDFPEHGAYYTIVPDDWPRAPLFAKRRPPVPIPEARATARTQIALERLARALADADVRLFYRDLTLPDVRALGLHVVRVLSPELTPLHGDERWPFVGGRARDVRWRWPKVDASEIEFPNRLPHPLG